MATKQQRLIFALRERVRGSHDITTKRATAKTENHVTEIRDGVTWYGKVVNYTTGPRLTWATFPHDTVHFKKIKRKHQTANLARLQGRHHGFQSGNCPEFFGIFSGPRFIESGYDVHAETKVVP